MKKISSINLMLAYNFWSEKNHGFVTVTLNICSRCMFVQAIVLEEKFMQTLVLSRNYKNKFRAVSCLWCHLFLLRKKSCVLHESFHYTRCSSG